MPWTSRGLRVGTDWIDGASTPAALALILTTDVPTWATKVQSELTEVANGNGYTTGGIAVALNSTDWPTETESDTAGRQYFERKLKTVSWTASGGNIPASGDGPKAVVLVDDAADPNVIAYIDLGSERTVVSGLPLTVTGFALRIGANLLGVPTQYEESGELSVTAGNGAKGSYVEAIASTVFEANRLVFIWEASTLDPLQVDIATGVAGSEVVLIPDIRQVGTTAGGSEKLIIPLDISIAAGTRIAVRVQASGGTPTVKCQVIIGGP